MSQPSETSKFMAGTPAGQPAVSVEQTLVPEGLLDGSELVLLAVKPSLWFIVLRSGSWLIWCATLGTAIWWLSVRDYNPAACKVAAQVVAGAAILRVVVAMFQWAVRLYVLTNKRVMRIKGVLHVDVFECALTKIQNTFQTFSLPERVVRIGSIHLLTAGTGSVEAVWQHTANPIEVHKQLREAITRAGRAGHGL